MPKHFDPNAYGPAVVRILAGLPLSPIGPGTPREELRANLESLDLTAACKAGMWLRCDFLNESHEISQELHSVEGSFWHTIMHRREPDAFNSKYWWRKVGAHPVIDSLVQEAPALGYEYTNQADFVDFCEKYRDTGSEQEELAKRVQQLEWELLFDHCFQQSKSG